MGSLSNLYISQSYQGLIHLATNTSASTNLIQLQDGLGNNLGVSLNTEGDISASGDLTANTLRIELDTEITGGVDINTFFTASTPGYTNSTNPYFTDVVRVVGSYGAAGGIPPTINDVKVGWICNGINVTNGVVTAVSGSGTGDVYVTIAGSLPQISQPYTFTGRVTTPVRITGSLQVSNDITASSMQLKGDLFVSGTINSNRVITTTISSSQIYSSGSNIFGDSISDSQTLVGGTTISGSLTVDGQLIHRGNVEITGSLKVSNDISSSTVNGIGNVTAYSASVDSRLDYLEGPFSTSVDNRLDLIEFFTSSEETKNITLAAYTGSNDTKWNTLTNVTASVLAFTSSQETKNITLGNYTASLINAFTASGTDVTFNGNINVSGSISAYQLNVLVESSSVIFSSGSNVLGDASNDTQTLNGTVNVVNTLFVSGTEFTPFSASVDSRLDQLETDSGSQAQRLNSLQLFTASQETKNSTLGLYTASVNTSISALQISTASLNVFTQSADQRLDSLEAQSGSWVTSAITGSSLITASSVNNVITFTRGNTTTFDVTISNASVQWSNILSIPSNIVSSSADTTNVDISINNGIISADLKGNVVSGSSQIISLLPAGTISGSSQVNVMSTTNITQLATTGSNTFRGSNTFSGSINGVVVPISIASQTASLDMNLGNFFTLTLPSSATNTHITATNVKPGDTTSLLISTIGSGSVTYSPNIVFPVLTPYIASVTNTKDILTFVSFDSSTIYGVATKRLS